MVCIFLWHLKLKSFTLKGTFVVYEHFTAFYSFSGGVGGTGPMLILANQKVTKTKRRLLIFQDILFWFHVSKSITFFFKVKVFLLLKGRKETFKAYHNFPFCACFNICINATSAACFCCNGCLKIRVPALMAAF